MRAAKVQVSLRIRAVSPEPSLLAHTSSESRGTFRQKARSLAPLNGWACAVKICHGGMLEDTNSLDGAQMIKTWFTIGHLTMYALFCSLKTGYLMYANGHTFPVTGNSQNLWDVTDTRDPPESYSFSFTAGIWPTVNVLKFRTSKKKENTKFIFSPHHWSKGK